MIEQQGPTMVEESQRRADWLKRLSAEYLKLEPLMPIRIVPEEGDCPQWVRKLEQEVGSVILPHSRVKEEFVGTPGRMGSVLGGQCANAVWMLEWVAMYQAEHQASATPESNGQKPTAEPVRQKESTKEVWFDEWYKGMRRLAKLSLCSSVDQSFDDMSSFLQAFAVAFAAKPRTLQVGEIGNTTFELYVFMLLHWRRVERLRSVSELHGLLVSQFGPHRAGDLKRVEKICQRIGLSFRRPGRPKKLE